MGSEHGKELMRRIRENSKRLESCGKHNFGLCPSADELWRVRDLMCLNCGGKMEKLQAVRYAEGYAAAGGDINDVLQGYR